MADDENKIYEIIETARATGKIKKGVNEATKCVEKGTAKLVVVASDVSPKEVIMHISPLAKEKGIVYAEVSSKEELGAAAGLTVPTAAIAVIKEGDAAAAIKSLTKTEKE